LHAIAFDSPEADPLLKAREEFGLLEEENVHYGAMLRRARFGRASA
jgi:hypothetical protein